MVKRRPAAQRTPSPVGAAPRRLRGIRHIQPTKGRGFSVPDAFMRKFDRPLQSAGQAGLRGKRLLDLGEIRPAAMGEDVAQLTQIEVRLLLCAALAAGFDRLIPLRLHLLTMGVVHRVERFRRGLDQLCQQRLEAEDRGAQGIAVLEEVLGQLVLALGKGVVLDPGGTLA